MSTISKIRIMEIRAFPDTPTEITDLEGLIKDRLVAEEVLWPEQAFALIGYMAWPNDAAARDRWLKSHKPIIEMSHGGTVTVESPIGGSLLADAKALYKQLKTIEKHWARVADIIQRHYDLAQGQHQPQRGGASIGKAISIIAAKAKSHGTREAKLWDIWSTYKDVAHLVTAAVLVAAEARSRHRNAPYKLRLDAHQPYRMGMLLPDLVISVAMTIEQYGLEHVPFGRAESTFDPVRLWRIPPDINLLPLAMPTRDVSKTDLTMLNARRAGNRGSVNRRKTTPVF